MTMAKSPEPKEKKPPGKDDKPTLKVVSDNRRARHEFEILEVVEAGVELSGTEVKSLRQGRANLADAFARVEEDQMWLYNCHISPYDHGNRFNHDPVRKRRLLMHKKQIVKLKSRIQEKGLTLVPLKLFFKGNWAKVDLALARGKLLYDKRQSITKRENQRQMERLVKRTSR
jgi:SsrA-binding protein